MIMSTELTTGSGLPPLPKESAVIYGTRLWDVASLLEFGRAAFALGEGRGIAVEQGRTAECAAPDGATRAPLPE